MISNARPYTREQLLEKRIVNLKERIRQLETNASSTSRQQSNEEMTTSTPRPSVLVLPVTYTAERDYSPQLEIVSYSPMDDTETPLLVVEQSNARMYETIV